MNTSPAVKPISTTSATDLERTVTWCTAGVCALLVFCALVWTVANYGPVVVAFLKTMVGLA